MDQELREQEWEKTRYQLGQIIKSWSKVNRIIEPEYVAYAVVKDEIDDEFCYLYDDVIVIHHLTEGMYLTITNEFELEDRSVLHLPDLVGKFVTISLEKYRFTQIIPYIEPVYRSIILGDDL